jgi:hypothetical protein
MREADLPDTIPNTPRRLADIETRPLAGVAENNRGSSLIMNPGDLDRTIIETKHGGSDGEMLSLALGFELVNAQPLVLGTGDNFVQARVQFGIGGGTIEAVVDVQNGTIIRFPATTVRVLASYTSLQVGNPPLRVFAMVGYGTQSARVSNARFTQRYPVIAAGASRSLAIPKFASAFTITSDSPGGPTSMRAEVAGGGVSSFYDIVNLNLGQVENFYVIPQGNPVLRLTNTNAFAVQPTVVYSLTL